jgi:hypothetical protein
MPFVAPLSIWMPGGEAIRHIQNAEQRIEADAIDQLKNAIAHSAIGVRVPGLPVPKRITGGGPGSGPEVSPGARYQPSPEAWTNARIGVNGKVAFGPKAPRYQFEVLRQQVVRMWPVGNVASLALVTDRDVGGRPSSYNDVAAILESLSAKDETLIHQVGSANFKPVADRIRAEAGKEPTDDGWRESALRKHFKRWLRSKATPA